MGRGVGEVVEEAKSRSAIPMSMSGFPSTGQDARCQAFRALLEVEALWYDDAAWVGVPDTATGEPLAYERQPRRRAT